MRITNILLAAATAAGLAVAIPDPATAQSTSECFDAEADSGDGGYVLVANAVGGCDGSQNTVFRGEHGLGQLSLGELIEQIVDDCNLVNGPYRRIDGLVGGDPRLDYVTAQTPTPTFGAATGAGNPAGGSVANQVGFSDGFEMSVLISGRSSANSAMFTVDENTLLNGNSQIFDVPGFEWIVFLKSSGNQKGTYVCDLNMWYDDGGATYGVKNFDLDHGVNKIIVGWAAGPSAFGSQDDITTACGTDPGTDPTSGFLNDGLRVANSDGAGPDAPFREKFTGVMVGFYKTVAGDPPPPTNITACSHLAADYARYCDSSEPIGSVNSCNPDNLPAGGIGGTNFGITGTGTCVFFGPDATGNFTEACW